MRILLEFLLFFVSWAAFAAVVFWLFSRLRSLRNLQDRVCDLEDAVFGFEEDEEEVLEAQPEVEASDEVSDDLAGAAEGEPAVVEAAGQPQD